MAGRICGEVDGKLNAKSIFIEGSRGLSNLASPNPNPHPHPNPNPNPNPHPNPNQAASGLAAAGGIYSRWRRGAFAESYGDVVLEREAYPYASAAAHLYPRAG